VAVICCVFVEKKNPFNDAQKARRLAFIARNSSSQTNKRNVSLEKKEKQLPIDLSAKDNKGGRGRYV